MDDNDMKLAVKTIEAFQKRIFDYYRKHGRSFPWRETNDPYAILVSEVMLQQTQSKRVVSFFNRWMKEFPTPRVLARASLGEILRAWSGLGYNRRALNLKRASETIVREYRGAIPPDLGKIDALPGVGPYTASAIGVFAFRIPSAFIETNIRTVYLHFFFRGRIKVSDDEILEVIGKTLPKRKIREWYNALMDYGAMLKKTTGHPTIRGVRYTVQSRFKGSRRELRGEVIRQASTGTEMTVQQFENRRSAYDVTEIFRELVSEGFLKKDGKVFKLAS